MKIKVGIMWSQKQQQNCSSVCWTKAHLYQSIYLYTYVFTMAIEVYIFLQNDYLFAGYTQEENT